MPKIVIAAGGTAGHVVPALAIADELRASGAEVSFVGTRDRVEAELVPAAGYEIAYLSVSGLDRANPLRAARALAQAGAAVAASNRLLGRIRPDAVLAAGGYVAGPVGLAAVLRRVPLVLSEADSRLGLSNRLLAPYARRVCLAFPLPGRTGTRYLVTGRPVPPEIAAAGRDAARARLGVGPEDSCVLVFGGSLGSRSINLTAFEAFAGRERSAGSPDVVLHVSGRRDHEELAARLARLESPHPGYRLHEYVETLADPLAAADLVVARAGGSIFELAAAGAPAVLVPYPHATADHQSSNARWMEEAGAAIVVPDRALEAGQLARVVASLLEDPPRLHAMSAAARRLARPDAARRVAAEVLDAAGAPAGGAPWAGRRLHFVGIGGAGMSGLALVSRQLGAEVSGCDRSESGYTAMLRDAGLVPLVGHAPEHVQPGMEVVVSTAVSEGEPELVAARERGAPVIRRGALLAQVASLRRLIAVAGTHGKTTTAAISAHCLAACGLDPGYVIGAELRSGGELSPNAALGGGEWMVAETDESDGSFLELAPEIAVVTNVELDHHTTYGSLGDVERAFRTFLGRLASGGAAVVWNRPRLLDLVPEGTRVISYGIEEPGAARRADISARNLDAAGLGTRFELLRAGEVVCEATVPVPGAHNVLNALAALAAAEVAGCDLERAARSLEDFRGVGRRFEPKGEGGGVRVFDDYAHHPTEVTATIEAARALEPARLIVVFQPHLYSRTLHLYRELGRALAQADVAVVLDVYAARERPEGELAGITGKLVADACADAGGGKQVWWLPTLDEAESVLSREIRAGDVVVTLGAGDVDRLSASLAASLSAGLPSYLA